MLPKRSRGSESSEEETHETHKRQKSDKSPDIIVDRIGELVDELNADVPQGYRFANIIRKIPQTLLDSGPSEQQVTGDLGRLKRYCTALQRRLVQGITDEAILIAATGCLDEIIKLVDDLERALFFKPAPSSYALASCWKVVQAHPKPILCLRPTDKHGLPLTLLHLVFSRFHQLRLQPLPNSPAGAEALRVALRLCSCMGDAFDNEKARGSAFDRALNGFLPGVDGRPRLQGHNVGGEADRVYRVDGRRIIFREDKLEIGTAGDAYPQVARSYDLACEEMEENQVAPDAPVFLLCVMGPSLTIAGGFKDGSDTVVEPLCPMLLMLRDVDKVTGRAMQLAVHLFALRACVDELHTFSNPPSPVAGLPRVFQTFQDLQNHEHQLTFRRRPSKDALLFTAVFGSPQEACVKIVYGPYGAEVHRTLAEANMAPKLFGVSHIEGGPTMIVMEKLDESWKTLYEFAQKSPRWSDNGVKLAIYQRLEAIVTRLEGGGLVHGDFRTNNVMVKEGEEGSAVLVDFDWAGNGDEVFYPLDRNHEATLWPGEVGSAIGSSHDREMLQTQWASLS